MWGQSMICKIPLGRTWQPTPGVLLEKCHGQWSLAATVHMVANSQIQLKWLSMHACTYTFKTAMFLSKWMLSFVMMPCSSFIAKNIHFPKSTWSFINLVITHALFGLFCPFTPFIFFLHLRILFNLILFI